jgi:hypothetical protein
MSFAGAVRVAVPLTAVAVLAVGCGASGTSSSPSPSPSPTLSTAPHIASVDACSLVTEKDASDASGTVVAASASGPQVPGLCVYTSADSTTFVWVFAEVFPDSGAAAGVPPEQLAASFHAAGMTNAKVVSGIGDRAFEYSASTGTGGIMIYVLKSNVALMIMMTPAPTDSSKIEQLARSAVGNLH